MSKPNEIFTAMAILKDWLGNGLSPVPQEVADRRAATCLAGNNGKECPFLVAPRWWQEHSTEPIAMAIKDQLEKKSEMKLDTSLDRVPSMCKKCGCAMPLKVWVPIQHIATHTPENKISEYPAYCWQRIEAENL